MPSVAVNERILSCDVLVVGGGPTGLLTAFSLLKAGLDVRILEKHDKSAQGVYGRACILFSRSIELLDQLGVYDEVLELGMILRGSATFREGKEVENRGWTFVDESIANNTLFDYSLAIRQNYSEEAFRRCIRSLDSRTLMPAGEVVDYTVDTVNTHHSHPVTATVRSGNDTYSIRCRYIIGADGSRSIVRQKANIEMVGNATTQRWIRMDAVVETDLPTTRTGKAVSIESPNHGNVLWLDLDHGRTRIGYALPKAISEAYDSGAPITSEIAIQEAMRAVAPYSLKVKTLDWYTAYSVAQRVANTYHEGRIFLAGDACHTHSSGTAQGMNTGIHDAVNLGWKLGGYLRGWFQKEVINTYDSERRTTALKMVEIDRDMASLIGGQVPAHLINKAGPGADAHEVLMDVFTRNAGFTVGLGISYDTNFINRSFHPRILSTLRAGHRAPDVQITPPDGRSLKRLYELLSHTGQFATIVFAGHSSNLSRETLKEFRNFFENSTVLNHEAIRWLTIIEGSSMSTTETLGTNPFGRVYFDPEGAAYEQYGVSEYQGAIVVVRPDSHIANAFELVDYASLEAYFNSILRPSKHSLMPRTNEKFLNGISITNGRATLAEHIVSAADH